MTEATNEKTKREPPIPREPLWVTDDQLAKVSGIPRDMLRNALIRFDNDRSSSFPMKNPLYGNRRYLPAVKAYWLHTNLPPKIREQLFPTRR